MGHFILFSFQPDIRLLFPLFLPHVKEITEYNNNKVYKYMISLAHAQ